MLFTGIPARAYGAGAQTIAIGTQILLNTRSFDPAGYFDIVTNHRYNVPLPGFYLVHFSVSVVSTGAGQACASVISHSGTNSTNGSSSYSEATGETLTSAGSDIVECVSGDWLELLATASSLALATSAAQNFLSVVQVG